MTTDERVTTDERFLIGAEAHSADGVMLGRLIRVIVDPVARSLTHLVVEPGRGHGAARVPGRSRLVPIEQVAGTPRPDVILLLCSAQSFQSMEEAVEEWFVPGSGEQTCGYHRDQVSSWPYFGLGATVGIDRAVGLSPAGGFEHGRYTEYDKVPVGEVDIHRGEPVQAADGPIGDVAGLVMDPRDRHVTHVLLDEGHLWGRKQIAIPIGAVTVIDGGIHVKLTKDDLRELPPVAI